MELITITAATIMSLFMNISGTANSNSHFHTTQRCRTVK